MNEILLTVIIPCFNSWNRMKRCIEFFENHLPKNGEVIFIDDCSSDGTYDNLSKICHDKNNWKVFRNEINSGPGISRNVGIQNSQGKYITFLDSDDWFEDSFFEEVIPLLEKNVDCVLYDYMNTDGKGWSQYSSIMFCKNHGEELSPQKAFVLVKGATCGKIFRRQIALDHDLRFLPDRICEDIPFTKCMISYCEKIEYIRKPLYCYYQHSNSLMHSDVRFKKNYSQIGFDYISQKVNDGFEKELEAVYAIECLSSAAVTSVRNQKRYEWKKSVQTLENRYPLYMNNAYLKFLSSRKKVVLKLINKHNYYALKIYVLLKDKVRK